MTTRAIKLAPFRPSSAEQWVNCQGAPRVNYIGSFIPDPPNDDADGGTQAHAYLEALLTVSSANAPEISDKTKRVVKKSFPDVSDEDAALIEEVADDVWWIKTMGGFEIYCERSFPVTIAGSTHESTVDILLVNASIALIIDFKWGAGKKINVRTHKQTLLYAHAVAAVYPGRVYQVGIYQPRGVGTGLDLWTVPKQVMVDSMVEFQAAGERAYAERVTYTPGDYCQFCDGRTKGLCPEYQSALIDAAVIDAEAVTIRPPWWVLDFDKHIRLCLEKLGKLADNELAEGRSVPGWQWTKKDGNRTWIDPAKTAAGLAELLGGDPAEYLQKPKPPAPITLTAADKIAKKKRVKLDALITRPTKFVRVKADKPSVPCVEPIE